MSLRRQLVRRLIGLRRIFLGNPNIYGTTENTKGTEIKVPKTLVIHIFSVSFVLSVVNLVLVKASLSNDSILAQRDHGVSYGGTLR